MSAALRSATSRARGDHAYVRSPFMATGRNRPRRHYLIVRRRPKSTGAPAESRSGRRTSHRGWRSTGRYSPARRTWEVFRNSVFVPMGLTGGNSGVFPQTGPPGPSGSSPAPHEVEAPTLIAGPRSEPAACAAPHGRWRELPPRSSAEWWRSPGSSSRGICAAPVRPVVCAARQR